MAASLEVALAELRGMLLDQGTLLRAVASGRRRGSTPAVLRAELRPITIKAGQRLQVVRDDGARPHTQNVAWGAASESTVDALLAEPFGNWHVVSTTGTIQLRVTKRGEAQLHRAPTPPAEAARVAHDRAPEHLLDPGDPLFDVIGGGAAKRRQVDAFLRALAATLGGDDLPSPLTVVDLGCGNAYLTFAAYRYLSGRGLDVRVTGVDVRDDQRERNSALARRLGYDTLQFVAGTIADARVETVPDVVLALHACDTATDDALARAVGWGSRWVLAAPCCHNEIASQLRRGMAGPPNLAPDTTAPGGPAVRGLLRDGILRQRFADVLTDALRAALLRSVGYRVEVVEFIDSTHTPRNVMLRAVRTGSTVRPDNGRGEEYQALAAAWGVTPTLARLLTCEHPLAPKHAV